MSLRRELITHPFCEKDMGGLRVVTGALQDYLGRTEQSVKHVFICFQKTKNTSRMCSSVCRGARPYPCTHRIRAEENMGSWQEWFSPGELWGFHGIYSLYFLFKNPLAYIILSFNDNGENQTFLASPVILHLSSLNSLPKSVFGTRWAEPFPMESRSSCVL